MKKTHRRFRMWLKRLFPSKLWLEMMAEHASSEDMRQRIEMRFEHDDIRRRMRLRGK